LITMEKHEFISPDLQEFLGTNTGDKVLRVLTPNIPRQKRNRIKKNLIELPEKYQELYNIKKELEKMYLLYEAIEADRGRNKKSK